MSVYLYSGRHVCTVRIFFTRMPGASEEGSVNIYMVRIDGQVSVKQLRTAVKKEIILKKRKIRHVFIKKKKNLRFGYCKTIGSFIILRSSRGQKTWHHDILIINRA